MVQENGYFNPFPGLRAFEEHEDVLFFGREKQVDELLRKLRTVRFLAVIGSSGSGKSSLVKSGLIPALHSGFMSGAGSNWRICSFRPGNDPIGNMAKSLVSDGVLYDNLEKEETATYASISEATLRRSNFGLIECYRQSELDPKNNLLILVDQFEELFRFSRFEKEAGEGKRDSVAFINLLLKAVETKEFPIYVVFTMRSDFLGDCTEFRGLPEAINEGQYLVPRMTREERREAITGPVAVGGALIAPRLLNQLLNDVGDNPDQLPILQHALMRTWDIWQKKDETGNREIDIEDYEDIGTMKHALSQHAEEAYAELTDEKSRAICEVIFKALTDKGSDARGIRRPRRLKELAELANAKIEEIIPVIEVFRKKGRAFLMPPADVALTPDSIIDISHESIMRVWDRLIIWVEEENQSAQIYLRLCEAAGMYETGKGGLWRDPELQLAWKWKEENNPNATWASRYNNEFDKAMVFLTHSKNQFELEMQQKEAMQKQRLKRARRIAAFISCVALLAFMLSIYAFQQRNIATKQRLVAVQKTEEANRQKGIAEQQKQIAEVKGKEAIEQKIIAEQKTVEAIEQKEIADKEKVKALQSEQNALMQKQIAEQQKNFAERQKQIAEQNEKIAREQRTIAEQQTNLAVKNEKIAVEEKQISARLKELAEARNLAYTSLLKLNENKTDESLNLALSAYRINEKNKGPFQNNDVYTALHFNWVNAVENKNQSNVHRFPVRCVAVNKATSQIITADESGLIVVSSADNGVMKAVSAINIKSQPRAITVSSDGKKVLLATANGAGLLFSMEAGNLKILSQFEFAGIARKIAFTSSNTFMVLSGNSLSGYTISNTAVLKSFQQNNNVSSFAVNGSGKIFIASGNKIQVFNTQDDLDKQPKESYSFNTAITSIAADEGGRYIAAGTYDGGIWVKDLISGEEDKLPLHKSNINDLKFGKTQGGRVQLASAGADQTIRLIDVKDMLNDKDLEDIITLKGHTKWVYGVDYSADGQYVFSVSEDKKIIAWHSTAIGLYKALNKAKD